MIINARRKPLDQGDIVKALYFAQVGDELPAVCVTPVCDLVIQGDGSRKADYVLFLGLYRDLDFFLELFKEKYKGGYTQQQVDGYLSKVQSIIKDNKTYRYYWVWNRYKEFGYIVDFQMIQAVSFEDSKRLKRMYSIKNPYREQLTTRYASYMGRVGSDPVVDLGAYSKKLIENMKNDLLNK